MYFFSLFVLFLLVGWVLAITRFSRGVDEFTNRLTSTFDRLNRRVRATSQSLLGRREKTDEFRAWALGGGALLFDDKFKSWLAGLSADEAGHFHQSLAEYSRSLGLDLADLIDGSLDHDPMLRQVFVEAVVVYSPAYRKARQAQKVARDAGHNGARPAGVDPLPAEKNPSRRKQPVTENGEAAPAV